MDHSAHSGSSSNKTSIPVLDKVDTWNIYKACLLSRLSEEAATDSFLDWPIDGEDVQRNCENSSQLEDLFPPQIVALLNYLHKLPFSSENPRAVKVFEEFCLFLEKEPALLTEEEAAILTGIQASFKGKKRSNQSLFTVSSLYLLSLPSLRRSRLAVVLRLLDKLFLDDYNGVYFDTAVERVASLVIKEEQADSLLHLLLADTETILGVDKKLLKMVEEAKNMLTKERNTDKVFMVSRKQIPSLPVAPQKSKRASNEDLLAVLDFLNDLEDEKEEKPKKKKKGFFSKVIQKTKM